MKLTLKTAGLPLTSAKYTKISKDRKLSSVKPLSVTTPKGRSVKSFDFSKFTKLPKAPKPKKIAILKKVIKKAKVNKGF